MALGVVLYREHLHLPAVGLAILIGIVVEWVGGPLPRAWNIQDLTAVEQSIVIAISIVGVSDVLV